MSFTFSCECGRVLRAGGGTAGRKAKCPACQRILTIPAPPVELAAEEAPAAMPDAEAGAPGAKCPQCGKAIGADAVVCVFCGFNVVSRRQAGTSGVGLGPAASAMSPTVKRIVAGAVIVVVLGAAWVFVGAPLLGGWKLGEAQQAFLRGDLPAALERLERLRAASAGERGDVELLYKQVKLEIEKNQGQTLHEGWPVPSDRAEMVVEPLERPSEPGVLFRVTIRNKGKTPLVLKQLHFYVRGTRDIKDVASHTANTIEGVVVAPGQSNKGIIAFRAMPTRGVGSIDVVGGTYYLTFNNGDVYMKLKLPF